MGWNLALAQVSCLRLNMHSWVTTAGPLLQLTDRPRISAQKKVSELEFDQRSSYETLRQLFKTFEPCFPLLQNYGGVIIYHEILGNIHEDKFKHITSENTI